MLIKTILMSALMALAINASAHSMSPGYQKELAYAENHSMVYKIENKFDFPIVLKVNVFEKDGVTPAADWTIDRELFKMVPGSKKQFSVTFKTEQERKVIVCSVLEAVGYEEETPTTITRVCSRLWLYK